MRSNCGILGVSSREGAMFQDAHGLEVTGASAAAVHTFDHTLPATCATAPTPHSVWRQCSMLTLSSAWHTA